MKPFDGLERSGMDAHIFHLSDEIQGVPTLFALAEAVPDILPRAHPELCRAGTFMDRTRAIEAVSAPLEPVREAIVFQDLLHGDGRFDGLEVNELCFGHIYSSSYVVLVNCCGL
jgi:hypothetical protein